MGDTYVGLSMSKLSGVGGRFGDCQNGPGHRQTQLAYISHIGSAAGSTSFTAECAEIIIYSIHTQKAHITHIYRQLFNNKNDVVGYPQSKSKFELEFHVWVQQDRISQNSLFTI